MTEPTLTQIAKKCRDSWRAWAQVDDEIVKHRESKRVIERHNLLNPEGKLRA